MSRIDRHAPAGAILALALLAAACSVTDRGINTTNVLEFDADGFSGGGGSGGGAPHLDGSVGKGGSFGGDGPAPAPADGPLAGEVGMLPVDAALLGLGATCNTDGLCGSGFCADGVCCNERCGDPCHSCGGGNGVTAGTCAPDAANTVCGAASCMGSTLTPAPRCDSAANCLPRPAAACTGNLTCASATACKTKCAASSDCTGGMVCDVATGACKVPGKPNGQACAAGSECSSSFCADKVCCDLACTGTCRACVMAQTGKPDGTCANVTAGMVDTGCVKQEASTCGRDGTCDGAGACHRYPNGTRCGTGCCRDNSGPGGGGADVCAMECSNGACQQRGSVIDRCGAGTCCCPSAPGGAACTGALQCGLGMCQ
jgi:hypothetical protein